MIFIWVLKCLCPRAIYRKRKNTFCTRCLDFFIESCVQINKRFDFGDNILKKLEIIDPHQVLSGNNLTIIHLARHFPNLIKESERQVLDNEWRLLRNTKLTNTDTIEQFWVFIKNMCYGDSTPMFLNVSNFVINLLCLPHSSANVE
ncbi:unnamed protein product [Psylliodes chrysocephalus]|uniref:Uncharacterized protein n=1 Tax=Psylliodes chrysocephalus TaxID=3402493 RepID=A0A9P0CVJ4_9CUCU|nr:unnamed protein product [Psylliodes chrysocephala]